jgi:hypothetical protein
VLYRRLKALQGGRADRCLLYVFRCAVYFAETPDPDPERLRWWYWKDKPARREPPDRRTPAHRPARPARTRPRAGTRA